MEKQFQLNLKKNKLKFLLQSLLKRCLDPQDEVVQNTLINMGINNLKNIRQGKHFEIEVDENDVTTAQKIDEICKKLLVNLIIEDYKINKICEIINNNFSIQL